MNAAADALTEEADAVPTELLPLVADGAPEDGVLVAVIPAVIDEAAIAHAMQEAERAARPVFDVLAEASGLTGERYTQALAAAFDYRFIADAELSLLDPDFSLLPPAEATRRRCVVVHERRHLVAVFTDPFDQALRGWLEQRVSEPMEWALAGRDEVANLIARRAESLRAIDAVLPATQEAARAEEGVDNLSYVRISEDTSPVVRLVPLGGARGDHRRPDLL